MKREAQIRSIYDADEIEVRVLNGDGGSWIKDPYEPETVFQLDRFHITEATMLSADDFSLVNITCVLIRR